MSWQIDTVTLPIRPTKVSDVWETDKIVRSQPNALPIVATVGRRRTLEIEGYIYVAGQSASYIDAYYLSPLRSKVGTVVTLSTPDSRYNGSYIVESFSYEEVPGSPSAFRFKMRLLGFSTPITL